MIIHLAPKNQLVTYRIIDIYMYPILKSYNNRFPLQACGNDADGVIPAGNAGIQLFRMLRYRQYIQIDFKKIFLSKLLTISNTFFGAKAIIILFFIIIHLTSKQSYKKSYSASTGSRICLPTDKFLAAVQVVSSVEIYIMTLDSRPKHSGMTIYNCQMTGIR